MEKTGLQRELQTADELASAIPKSTDVHTPGLHLPWIGLSGDSFTLIRPVVDNPKKTNRQPVISFQYPPVALNSICPDRLTAIPVSRSVKMTPRRKKKEDMRRYFFPEPVIEPEYPATAVNTGTVQQEVARPRKPKREAVSRLKGL